MTDAEKTTLKEHISESLRWYAHVRKQQQIVQVDTMEEYANGCLALLDENEQLDVYNKTLEADLKQTEIYLYDAREQLEKALSRVNELMQSTKCRICGVTQETFEEQLDGESND